MAERKTIARNKKAWHEYEILEKFEAGLALTGTEIKSIRDGNVAFRDSYVEIKNGEAILTGFHIAPYICGNRWNHAEDRPRTLLLHKREILKWSQKVKERGFTVIPLELYLDEHGRAKMQVALVRGKALHDKRDTLRKKEMKRELDRARSGER
ncbi:MAG TPA: SsrA-binding protein SmpB [bacterium]|nr:SsrA-binding protein SmpB [bacterium]